MRLLIPVAALVVLAALILVPYWVGYRAGKARQRRLARDVDPDTFNDLATFAGHVLYPANPIDDVVVVPGWMRAEGVPAYRKAMEIQRNRSIYPTH